MESVSEFGIASIVHIEGVSLGQVKLSVPREGDGQNVSYLLQDISQLAPLMITVNYPSDLLRQMLPKLGVDLRQGATPPVEVIHRPHDVVGVKWSYTLIQKEVSIGDLPTSLHVPVGSRSVESAAEDMGST